MPTTNQHPQTDESVLLAWRALLEEAQDKPWLAGLLARRGTQIFNRFVNFYRYLRSLPRRLRRTLNAKLRRRLAAGLLGAALLFALQPARNAQAASITVDGSCTLADAITAANNDAASGSCPAGSGPDTIDLQVDVTLSSALPAITSQITLEGNGYKITGSGDTRVLEVSGDLTLNEATITGGAVDQDTSLDPMQRIGGGIYISGTGSGTINNSTITNNTAYYGAGIFNYGTLTINNSTISGNTVTGPYPMGGGIYNSSPGTTTLNNSTVSGNTGYAGGGIVDFNTVTVNNSTITGNTGAFGGGIYAAGGPTLNRSVISGNTASSTGDEIHVSYLGTVTADNHNVIGYNNDSRSAGFTPGASDIVPGPGVGIDDILNTTLADNGGPTLTHALVSGSPAIDVAPDADCTASPVDDIDQRSAPRNVDGDSSLSSSECDAGAFEFGSTPTAVALTAITAQAAGGGGLLPGLGALALGVCTAGYKLWSRVVARTGYSTTSSG